MVDGNPSGISPDAFSTQESQPEINELSQAQDSLDKASAEPLAEIQASENLQVSTAEDIEKEIKETMEAVTVADATSAQEIISPITLEGVGQEGTLIIGGGQEDKFSLDDGAEQVVDLKEDNQIKSQYGDVGDPKDGSVDFQGDPAHGVEGIPDFPDNVPDLFGVLPGEGGGDEITTDIPGPDQASELDDLADAAAFGADGRRSDGAWTGKTSMTDSTDSDGRQDISYDESYEDDDHSMTVTTTHSDGVTTQTVTHTNKKTGETTTETTTSGDESDASPPSTDQEEYDPEGYEETEFDETLGGLIKGGALPKEGPLDGSLDLTESMSQPVDEDSASPKEPGVVFDRGSQADPYRQDTDEYVDLPRTTPVVEENFLVDPPDFAGGEGGGLKSGTMNTVDEGEGYAAGGDEGGESGEQPKPGTEPEGAEISTNITFEGLLTEVGKIENQLDDAAKQITAQAVEVFREQVLAKGAETDFQALATNIIGSQTENLSQEQSNQILAVVVARTAESLQSTGQGRSFRQSDTTAFENFDQKSNQLFTILAKVLKSIKEMNSSVKRNML